MSEKKTQARPAAVKAGQGGQRPPERPNARTPERPITAQQNTGVLAQVGTEHRASQSLRQRAEETARVMNTQTTENAEALLPEDTRRLLHELRVHQIELEMQNEELRRIQIELEDARARYFDLYDLAPVGYLVLSEKGLIQKANLTAASLMGVVRNALVKKSLSRFILPEDQDIYYLHRKMLFETGAPQTCTLRLLRVDTPFWAQVDTVAAQDSDGATVFRTVLNDISMRKQAEDIVKDYTVRLEADVAERTHDLYAAQEQLVSQERLAVLGQLAGGVGHELRNPLGVISNAVYYLKMVQPDASDEVKEYLNIIENETCTSVKIITDLLDFARIKSVDPEPVSVSELVQRVLERYPPTASVTVTQDFPPGLPKFLADPRQMEQVLGNLTVNACQAMPEGGELTFSARQEGVDGRHRANGRHRRKR